MYPVLVEIAGVRLHSYGVAVATAVLLALWLAGREARRRGLAPNAVEEVGAGVVLAGLAGARLAYVLGWEPELLWSDPIGVVAVWRGGLALHGGLLAGFATGVWLCRHRKLDPWRLADAAAPGALLGQAIGRIGCFLSGDAYGLPTTVPWAVIFTHPAALAPRGIPLHPVQLYEAALDLVLLAALWAVRRRVSVSGGAFLFYVAGYGAIRLLTEVFRGDRVELVWGLSWLQAASLALLAAALLALGWRWAGLNPWASGRARGAS